MPVIFSESAAFNSSCATALIQRIHTYMSSYTFMSYIHYDLYIQCTTTYPEYVIIQNHHISALSRTHWMSLSSSHIIIIIIKQITTTTNITDSLNVISEFLERESELLHVFGDWTEIPEDKYLSLSWLQNQILFPFPTSWRFPCHWTLCSCPSHSPESDDRSFYRTWTQTMDGDQRRLVFKNPDI